MRIVLGLYVFIFVALNFVVDDPLIFVAAISSFPVALYLLLSKPKQKNRAPVVNKTEESRQPAELKS